MSKVKVGRLYLLPCTLGGEQINDVIPTEVQQIATALRVFAVEDLKSARRLLRKLDREFPIDDSQFFVLNKRTSQYDLQKVVNRLLAGDDVGILSEAGCPGIADPGADLVALAHQHGVHVSPTVGPSSILLTLMGSGFNGQSFTFHGYLPKDRKDRVKKLKDFEFNVTRTGFTNLFMDTPFRNMNVLDDLLNELGDQTELCIASNLTCHNQRIETMTVEKWREHAYNLAKSPTMFAIGKSVI